MTDNIPDLADIISGALKVSRAQAYRMMTEAVRLNAQTVPDGWVLVPVEATLDMLDAFRNHDDSVLGPDFLGAYRAMLSAAPAAPQPAQQPLTDEQFQKIRRSLMQQSGWDGDGWDQALKEAIEQAHGIGVKND